MQEPPIDSRLARLELNAKSYRYDATLDPIADRLEAGDRVLDLPPRIVDLASIHLDFRRNYRAAVAAGAVADDRHPPAA